MHLLRSASKIIITLLYISAGVFSEVEQLLNIKLPEISETDAQERQKMINAWKMDI